MRPIVLEFIVVKFKFNNQVQAYMTAERLQGLQNTNNFYCYFSGRSLKDEQGNPKQMKFTEEEKEGLVAFLETLTGLSPMGDQDLSDPFK